MDLIWNNSLATMYGPTFLAYYGLMIVLMIFFVWRVVQNSDESRFLEPLILPDPIDPYEFAALRGGKNEIVRLLLFELLEKKWIQIVEEERQAFKFAPKYKVKMIQRTENDPSELQPLSRLAQTALDWFQAPRATDSVFQSSPLVVLAEEQAKIYKERFVSEQLVYELDRKKQLRCIRFCLSIFLALIAFYKTTAAVYHGHSNVFFLWCEFAFAFFASKIILSQVRLTSRGKTYLEAVQEPFQRSGRIAEPFVYRNLSTDRRMLFIGACGVAILAHSDLIGTVPFGFSDTFIKHAASSGGGCGGGEGCGGGCSGGCGGCGGGCGGCGD